VCQVSIGLDPQPLVEVQGACDLQAFTIVTRQALHLTARCSQARRRSSVRAVAAADLISNCVFPCLGSRGLGPAENRYDELAARRNR
jgi:hypothetical protein